MLDPVVSVISRGVVRHRILWSGGIVLVLGIALVLAAQLSLSHRAEDLLPRRGGSPDSVQLAVRQLAGGVGRVVIFLESPEPLAVTHASPLLDTLATRLGAIPGVRRVEHRLPPELRRYLEQFGHERMVLYLHPVRLEALGDRLSRAGIEEALLAENRRGDGSDLAAPWGLTRSDPLGVLAPAIRLLERASGQARIRLVGGYFALPGSRTFFLTVELASGLDEVDRTKSVVRRIEEVLGQAAAAAAFDSLPVGTRLFAVGRPVSYVNAYATARADMHRVATASGIVVLILLALFFRNPVAPVILLAPVAFGLVLTGAVAFLVFGSVSLIAGIFVALLIGLGVDFGLHIATHYWVSGNPTAVREAALASAMRRPGWGILFGALTSAAAFFSLVVVSYPVMTQLAWLTAIGLLAILLASLTVLPWAISFTASTHRRESVWPRWGTMVYHLGLRRPRVGLVVWLVLVAGSLWAARSISFEPHPWKIALRGNPKTAEMERVRAQLGSSFTPLLMVSRGTTREEALAIDREAIGVLDDIGALAGVASVESLSRWLPEHQQQQTNIRFVQAHADVFSPERFRRDFTEVVSQMDDLDPYLTDEYLPLLVQFLNPAPAEFTIDDLSVTALGPIVDRHLVRMGDDYLAVAYVYLTRFPWAEGAIDRFLETTERHGGDPLDRVTFVGSALRSATHQEILRRDSLVATAVAFALVSIILLLQFRRLKPAVLCLLPLACGVSVALGFMGLWGIELNVLTLSVAPVLVGIGVDDGIHMMQRFQRGEASLTVLQETGSAMTMTTLTTVAAYLCFGFASFAGVGEVGLVGAVGLTTCLLASLHLLPIVARAVGR